MKALIKILFITLFISSFISAQNENKILIKGQVLDQETNKPLEFVNVFLDNTTIGTITDKNGEFVLKFVPYGNYRISFSYIGYEVESRNLDSYKPHTFNFQILLNPKPINIDQVDVEAEVPEAWMDNLEIFKRIFIGETENSDDTKILNPEILNFVKNENGKLTVYSDSTLKVENKALGYLIYIVIDSVVYVPESKIVYKIYPRFEELIPNSEDQKEEWKVNRDNTYLDSPRYFFYSMVHKQLSVNYFSLYDRYGSIIPENDLNLTCDRDSTIYKLKYSGIMEVVHHLTKKNTLTFYYTSVSIDKYGNLLSYFYPFEINGYWGNKRIADILPSNYVYKEN